MKRILVALLALSIVAFAAPAPAGKASNKVKSKQGSVQLTKSMGGSDAACTADFNDEMNVLKKEGEYVLVKNNKANCQGWVANANVEYVAAAAGDKNMNLEGVDVVGWLDNPSAVFVLENDAGDFGGVDINRDFREYLKQTEDREKTEYRNQEN